MTEYKPNSPEERPVAPHTPRALYEIEQDRKEHSHQPIHPEDVLGSGPDNLGLVHLADLVEAFPEKIKKDNQ